MLSNDKKAYLKGISSQLVRDKNETLKDLLLNVFANNSIQDRLCATMETQSITYRELRINAEQISHSLRNTDRIALIMFPSLDFITIVCATILSEIFYVPIELTSGMERIQYIIKHSGIQQVICDDKSFNYLYSNLDSSISLKKYSKLFEQSNTSDRKLEKISTSEDTFCLMYTSGSTGVPKGVHLTHRALIHRLRWQWKRFPYDDEDVSLMKTSISFVDSISELFSPLLSAIPIIILEKQLLLHPDLFIEKMNKYRITRIILVPSLLKLMLETFKHSNIELQHLKSIVSSGDILTGELVQMYFQFKHRFSADCRLINLYGSTEMMGDVTFQVIESIEEFNEKMIVGRYVSIGFPIDNHRIDLINQDEQGVGQLVVQGQHVFHGYHNSNDSLSIDAYPKKYFTGDLAFIRNDRIFFYGRNDSQIKLYGIKIDLNEIEMVTTKLIQPCRCRVLFDKTNQSIVLFVEGSCNVDRSNLEAFLPAHSIPSRIIYVSKFPCLPSGKIDCEGLLKSLNHYSADECSIDDHEKFVLALESVGLSSKHILRSFNDAGGTSIHALSLFMKLKSLGYIDLTIEDIYRSLSLQDLYLNRTKHNSRKKVDFPLDEKNQFVSLDYVDSVASINLIVESLRDHSRIDQLVHRNEENRRHEYADQFRNYLKQFWSSFEKTEFSFGLISSEGNLLGLSISVDEKQVSMDPLEEMQAKFPLLYPIFYSLDFVHQGLFAKIIETKKTLPVKILDNQFIIVNHQYVSVAQRASVTYHLERQTLNMAQKHHFDAIVTINTNQLTQKLAKDIFHYDEHFQVFLVDLRDCQGKELFPNSSPDEVIVGSIKYFIE